jgi:heptaprenyl diphosphate synthase/octaprenyl-diphosphate synthase
VHYFAQMLELDPELVRPIAVTAELIHAASLVHDDVVDEADARRGNPTVHSKWNTLTAVLSGDFMFALAFQHLHALPHDVMTTAAAVLREMSCAVMDEFEARGSIVEMEPWREIAEGKTGSLFAWCGLAPAIVAGDADARDAFERVGRHFGVAFQLADDIKDVLPNQGKDRFQDIVNGNPSFLTSIAAEKHPPLVDELHTLWKSGDTNPAAIEELGLKVIEFGFPQAVETLKLEIECGLHPLQRYASPAADAFRAWTEENLSAYLNVVSI